MTKQRKHSDVSTYSSQASPPSNVCLKPARLGQLSHPQVRATGIAGMQGPTLVQKTTIGNVFDPTAIRNEPVLSNHDFKFTCVKL